MNETAPILPTDFNGTFYFTNPTESEFSSRWNSIEYRFPAGKTVPLIIPEHNPLEVQEIRKKFARELATLMFYESDKYKLREAEAPMGSGKVPAIFTEADLAPYVQMCIQPKPLDTLSREKVEIDQTEKKLVRDEEGKRRTKILKGDETLAPEGAVIA